MFRTFFTIRKLLTIGGLVALLGVSGSASGLSSAGGPLSSGWAQSMNSIVANPTDDSARQSDRAAARAKFDATAADIGASIDAIRSKVESGPSLTGGSPSSPSTPSAPTSRSTGPGNTNPSPTGSPGSAGSENTNPSPTGSGPTGLPPVTSPPPTTPPPTTPDDEIPWTFNPPPPPPPTTTPPPAVRVTSVNASFNGFDWRSSGDFATPERCPGGGISVSWTATLSTGATTSGSSWVPIGSEIRIKPAGGGTISFGYYTSAGGGCWRSLGHA